MATSLLLVLIFGLGSALAVVLVVHVFLKAFFPEALRKTRAEDYARGQRSGRAIEPLVVALSDSTAANWRDMLTAKMTTNVLFQPGALVGILAPKGQPDKQTSHPQLFVGGPKQGAANAAFGGSPS
jgi:hypothetical protein